MGYYENRKRANIETVGPTKTDQSQARDTDINIILHKFGVTGRVQGVSQGAITGDFTQMPKDLREMIELGRSVEDKRKNLPPELRDLSLDELFGLTPEALKAKLTPPKKEEPKEKPKETE